MLSLITSTFRNSILRIAPIGLNDYSYPEILGIIDHPLTHLYLIWRSTKSFLKWNELEDGQNWETLTLH